MKTPVLLSCLLALQIPVWTSAAAGYDVIARDQEALLSSRRASFSKSSGSVEVVDVEGQAFPRALRIEVARQPAKHWEFQCAFPSIEAVARGTLLTLRFSARAINGDGRLSVKVQGPGEAKHLGGEPLHLSSDWQSFEITGICSTTARAGVLEALFMLGYQTQTIEIGGITLEAAAAEPPDLEAAVRTPPKPPAEGLDGYGSHLVGEISKQYGVAVMPLGNASEARMAESLRLGGPAASGARMTSSEASGQPFSRKVSVEVLEPRGENWHIMAQLRNPADLVAGRSYIFAVNAKGHVPGLGGMEALGSLSIKNKTTGEALGTTPIVVGDAWRPIFVPFSPQQDIAAGEAEAVFVLGVQQQVVDLGGITWLDAGPAPLESLPGARVVSLDYEGREAGACWRAEALDRIQKIRMSTLEIAVRDSTGRPVPSATIQVEQTGSSFLWGTAAVPGNLVFNKSDPLAALEKDAILKYFNALTVDIDLKARHWSRKDDTERKRVLEAVSVFRDAGLSIRGHTMVWPGFRTNPHWLPLKETPDQLRAAIENFIRDVGSATAPYVADYDVVNEPFGDREFIRMFGPSFLADCFKLAREVMPNVRLWLNEAGLTSRLTGQDEVLIRKTIEELRNIQACGGPIHGFGDQAHFSSPTPPTRILEIWDRIHKETGLRLAVTEFDAKFGPGQAHAEADFTRDVLIAAFSHPAMDGFTMWGILDESHWLKHAPIFRAAPERKYLDLKPSGYVWMDLVHNQWRTQMGGATDSEGRFQCRGYHGAYLITASKGKATRTVSARLDAGGAKVDVVLD